MSNGAIALHERNALIGVLLMVFGCGLITLNDLFMKVMVGALPLGELVFIRAVVSLGMLALMAPWLGGWARLRPKILRDIGLSSFFLVAAYFLFPASLYFLPLTEAIVLAYISPILVVGLAPFMIGESSNWRQWCAVIVGFGGVGLVIQPDMENFELAYALPLGVAACIALRDMLTRRIALRESAFTITTAGTIAAAIFASFSAPFGWHLPSVEEVMVLSASGVVLTLGQIVTVTSFRYAEAPIMSTFKYSSILWAVLFGYFYLGEALNREGTLGAVLIVASGVAIVVFRQRRMPALDIPTVSRQSAEHPSKGSHAN